MFAKRKKKKKERREKQGRQKDRVQTEKRKMVGLPEELEIVEEVRSRVRHTRRVWVLAVVA